MDDDSCKIQIARPVQTSVGLNLGAPAAPPPVTPSLWQRAAEAHEHRLTAEDVAAGPPQHSMDYWPQWPTDMGGVHATLALLNPATRKMVTWELFRGGGLCVKINGVWYGTKRPG